MNKNNAIRILIVDDIAETRRNIRDLLKFEEYVSVVGMARSGNEGIQLATELDPDVILMDINMPDIDGITATELIRKRHPHIQIVILSVQTDISYMRRAMLAGARDYLTKPPLGDELISAIRRAGEMADSMRKGVEGQKEKIQSLLLQEVELDLTYFDLDTRLDLYKQNLIAGKLVDSIEALVSGLAHDLRSPITIILSILSTIKTTDKEMANILKKIWRRSAYCKWVADNFLGISLSEKKSVSNTFLKVAVDETIGLLENRIPDTVEIQNKVDEEIQVAIDVGLFRLVLLNLISNSLESIADNGVISISLERTSDKTAIFVADNGAQISPDSAQNLFKLGFTTKKSHAGIGLYVSTRLLRQQHGDLSFARDFHKQTKNFCVMLPEYNLFEKTSTNIDALTILINQKEYYVSQLQAKLSTLRNQNVSKSQEEEISKQFKLLTTAFSQNLSNELLVIEATVLDVIQRLPADNIPLKNSFQKIINNCAYCRLLTRNILELGEGIAPKLMEFSLIDTAKDILSLVDRKMPSHLYKIDLDIDPLLPNIEADEVQMKQVFMNLIKNALDAMPNGGTLSIRIIQDENFALIEIGDTGAGIPPENITRLFHLGFTTKPRGYGIGLYSIKNILDRHHGTIEVFSKIQKGTIFRFRLPLKQSFER